MGIRMLSGSGSGKVVLELLVEQFVGCDAGSETSRMLELGDGRYSALGIEPTVLGSGL